MQKKVIIKVQQEKMIAAKGDRKLGVNDILSYT